MFAIEPGWAVVDRYFLIIFTLGLLVWLLIAFSLKIKRKTFIITLVLGAVLLPIYLFISVFIVYKTISVDEPNPFAYLDGESGGAHYTVTFLDWPYWFPARLQRTHLENIQPSRLIKFSQNKQYLRIRGADQTTVLEAFGEPSAKRANGMLEVWEYHPWREHSDWIMPVYLKGGTLWSVGSPNELQ